MLKYSITLLFHVLFFACIGQQEGEERSDSCLINIVLADFDTKLVLNGQFGVHTKSKSEIVEVIKGSLELTSINHCDTIYISPKQSVYQDTFLTGFGFRDTIYLRSNSYEFEEVEIFTENRRVKRYELGKRNRKANHYYYFQSMEIAAELDQEFLNFKFASHILNNLNENVTIEEMYIFVDKIPKDYIPNLYVSFYKNSMGKPGKPIVEKLKLDKIDQLFLFDDNRGWAEVLFPHKIKLPEEGCFVVLEKRDIDDYSPGVASINTAKQLNLSTYSSLESWEDGWIYPNTIIKTFIKAYHK
jgi:hypothetical protein